jgi:hypothetical protein
MRFQALYLNNLQLESIACFVVAPMTSPYSKDCQVHRAITQAYSLGTGQHLIAALKSLTSPRLNAMVATLQRQHTAARQGVATKMFAAFIKQQQRSKETRRAQCACVNEAAILFGGK